MEEIYIKSADLDVEDVARESATQTVTLSSPKDSLYKIYRQGDKIHQIRDENVTMVQGGTATQRTSVEPEEQMDEISSGESLFKTFTFNNGITKEETEKCLSFWRSVVEKNLEPIKCSIIENIEKLKGDCDERKKEKCQKKRNIKKPSKLETHSDCATPQKNVWCDIMNELQKKRINETKLLMEKRCRFCGYVNSPPYETEDLEKQTLSMINELSTWQPKSHKRKELLTKKIAGITKENGKGKRLSQKPQWDKNSQEEERSKEQVNEEDKDGVEPDKAEEEEEEKMQKAQDALVKNIKQDSSKLKYVDGIQDKKEQGLDSKWRKNKMEPCKCDRPECDCNISPSIKSVEEVSPDKIKSTLVDYPTNTETAFQVLEEFSSEVEKRLSLSNDVLNIFTKECEEENKGGSCQKVAGSTEALINNIITNEPIKEKKDFLQLSKKQMRKSSLAILNCVCSNEKCDCFRKLTFPERATLPLSKIELSPDTANFAVQKLNSVDIREKNLRVSSNIEESLEIKSRKSLISNRGESRKLSRKSVDSLTLLKKRSSKNYQNKNKDADEDELKYEPQ